MRMTIGHWTTLSEGPDSLGGLGAHFRAYMWRSKTGAERRSLQTCVPVGRPLFAIIGTTMNNANGATQRLSEVIRIAGTFGTGPAPAAA
jgi:hypothetical protein